MTMAITVLFSVSLLALVSTARPVEDKGLDVFDQQFNEPEEIQNVVKAVLKSNVNALESKSLRECLDCQQEIQIRLTSSEEQQSILQDVNEEDVEAIIPIDGENFHSADESLLFDILNHLEMKSGRNTPVPDEMLDQVALSIPESDPQNEHTAITTVSDGVPTAAPMPTSPTLVVVLALSCIASLLLLACVGVGLYAAQVIRDGLFQSRTAWDVLPKLEKQGGQVDGPGALGGFSHDQNIEYPEKRMILAAEVEDIVQDSHNTHIPGVSKEPSLEDLNERFYDCQCEPNDSSVYSTPVMSSVSLPIVTRPSTPTPVQNPALRPQWSVRAADYKLPQLPSPSFSTARPAGATNPDRDRRRAFAAIPELDAALAMQLRPGLGLGAMVDAAWLVRFVMALFGWCAVLMSGKRETERRWH